MDRCLLFACFLAAPRLQPPPTFEGEGSDAEISIRFPAREEERVSDGEEEEVSIGGLGGREAPVRDAAQLARSGRERDDFWDF